MWEMEIGCLWCGCVEVRGGVKERKKRAREVKKRVENRWIHPHRFASSLLVSNPFVVFVLPLAVAFVLPAADVAAIYTRLISLGWKQTRLHRRPSRPIIPLAASGPSSATTLDPRLRPVPPPPSPSVVDTSSSSVFVFEPVVVPSSSSGSASDFDLVLARELFFAPLVPVVFFFLAAARRLVADDGFSPAIALPPVFRPRRSRGVGGCFGDDDGLLADVVGDLSLDVLSWLPLLLFVAAVRSSFLKVDRSFLSVRCHQPSEADEDVAPEPAAVAEADEESETGEVASTPSTAGVRVVSLSSRVFIFCSRAASLRTLSRCRIVFRSLISGVVAGLGVREPVFAFLLTNNTVFFFFVLAPPSSSSSASSSFSLSSSLSLFFRLAPLSISFFSSLSPSPSSSLSSSAYPSLTILSFSLSKFNLFALRETENDVRSIRTCSCMRVSVSVRARGAI